MARMMPAYCPESAPPGERAVYAALRSGDGTSDWIVLHSLGIANHVRQVESEADFVVIVPGKGMLVLEVKSHHTIGRTADGLWKLGNDTPTARGPFQQASEARHSIERYLTKKGVDLRSVPMLSAVWFTHVRARTVLPSTPEWHDWQVLDSEDLRRGGIAAVLRTLADGAKHLDSKIRYFSYGGLGPDSTASVQIAALLRPRFEVAIVAGDMRRARHTELVTFIEEQYLALDAMADNQAVLFMGPAGTGKTLLAVEAARREVAQGRAGRLLCFNKLLGRQLSAGLEGLPVLSVATLHQELLRISGARVPPDADARFWAQDLPDAALEALIDQPELAGGFLIIDEIQDIAEEPYLDVLDLMVSGGLAGGRVLLFGDFERQAIFECGDGRTSLHARVPRLCSHRLTANCRNLPRIGYQVNLFSKLEPGYRLFRRQDDGVDPTLMPYRAASDQSPLLAQAVRTLKGEGYELDEIVVLSPLRSGSTAETTIDPWLRQVLHPADGRRARPGRVQHSTIQAFKGLEAPAVVVTDLDHRLVPGFESLMYVGLTRATDRLFVVIEAGTARMMIGGRS